MKKLMVMAVVVCAAVAAQAAKVYWSASPIPEFVDGYSQSKSQVEDGQTVTVYYSRTGAQGGTTSAVTKDNGFTSDLSRNLPTGNYTVYYKIVWGAKEFTSDSVQVAISSGKADATESHSLATTGTWKDYATDPSPEPTSGLLMLLGMGMLALKRKRA